jgi:hypothetical protein
MPFFTAETSELEAVNEVLFGLRRPPLTVLPTEGTGPQEVQLSRQQLYREDRALQSRGWFFNTSIDETLTEAAGAIAVSDDVITVKPLDNGVVATIRDGTLYDPLTNSTTSWSSDIACDVVRLIPWESCPQTFRDYVISRTAANVYRTLVGTDSHLNVLISREEEARRMFRAEDIRMYRAHSADTYLGQRIYGHVRSWRPQV